MRQKLNKRLTPQLLGAFAASSRTPAPVTSAWQYCRGIIFSLPAPPTGTVAVAALPTFLPSVFHRLQFTWNTTAGMIFPEDCFHLVTCWEASASECLRGVFCNCRLPSCHSVFTPSAPLLFSCLSLTVLGRASAITWAVNWNFLRFHFPKRVLWAASRDPPELQCSLAPPTL